MTLGLWHITEARHRTNIYKEGLQAATPSGIDDDSCGVYAWRLDDVGDAWAEFNYNYAHSGTRYDVWRIREDLITHEIDDDPAWSAGEAVIIRGSVPSHIISRFKTYVAD